MSVVRQTCWLVRVDPWSFLVGYCILCGRLLTLFLSDILTLKLAELTFFIGYCGEGYSRPSTFG